MQLGCWCSLGVLVTGRAHFCNIDGRVLGSMQFAGEVGGGGAGRARARACEIDGRGSGGQAVWVLAQVLFWWA